MRLTCVLIVAVLSLTACQLITADDSRDKQEYLAGMFRDGMRNSKVSRDCQKNGDGCTTTSPCCKDLRCLMPDPRKNAGICVKA
uniref:Conotoxin n=1 Tax=Conus praecellens TaxID=128530 RepID=A0A291C2P2_CONPC|nr:conotoxin [Conus praecellens]